MLKNIDAVGWLGLAVGCLGADVQPRKIAFVNRQVWTNHIYLIGRGRFGNWLESNEANG